MQVGMVGSREYTIERSAVAMIWQKTRYYRLLAETELSVEARMQNARTNSDNKTLNLALTIEPRDTPKIELQCVV